MQLVQDTTGNLRQIRSQGMGTAVGPRSRSRNGTESLPMDELIPTGIILNPTRETTPSRTTPDTGYGVVQEEGNEATPTGIILESDDATGLRYNREPQTNTEPGNGCNNRSQGSRPRNGLTPTGIILESDNTAFLGCSRELSLETESGNRRNSRNQESRADNQAEILPT